MGEVMADTSDNCRLCGEPLTEDEQEKLKDQCHECTDEVAD